MPTKHQYLIDITILIPTLTLRYKHLMLTIWYPCIHLHTRANVGIYPPLRLMMLFVTTKTCVRWSVDEMREMTGDDGRKWMTMTVDGRDAPVHGDLRTVLAPAPNCMAAAHSNPRRPNDMQKKNKKKALSNARILFIFAPKEIAGHLMQTRCGDEDEDEPLKVIFRAFPQVNNSTTLRIVRIPSCVNLSSSVSPFGREEHRLVGNLKNHALSWESHPSTFLLSSSDDNDRGQCKLPGWGSFSSPLGGTGYHRQKSCLKQRLVWNGCNA